MKIKNIFLSSFLLGGAILSLSSCLILTNVEDSWEGFRQTHIDLMQEEFNMELPFCEGYSYKFQDNSTLDFSMSYFVDGVSETDYQAYLEDFKDYTYLGMREDDLTTYTTYYNDEVYAYMDICYTREDLFSTPYLNVYLYHRGYVDLYNKYYTNKLYPISNQNETYSMSSTNLQTLRDVNGYKYYCPSSGNVKILVAPVDFSDAPASKCNFSISELKEALEGSEGDYPSLKSYYSKSSYGKLNLSFEVINNWYRAPSPSLYYNSSKTISTLVDSILKYYDDTYNYQDFDSDKNGAIDGIILVHTLESSSIVDIAWPATRNNVNENKIGNKNTFDDTFAYRFYHINYDQIKEKGKMNTYTLIHEFGHLMGLDDYYDTSYTNRTFLGPLGGHDVMDAEYGDQNAFSKLLLGWCDTVQMLNKSREITLKAFEGYGDMVILGNNFDGSHGPFQEYYILVYNKGDNLNAKSEYLNKEGLILYHVDGCLYDYNLSSTYMNYNNDQSGPYSERFNLIEFAKKDYEPYILSGSDTTTTLDLKDNNGLSLSLSIEILEKNSDSITLDLKYN